MKNMQVACPSRIGARHRSAAVDVGAAETTWTQDHRLFQISGTGNWIARTYDFWAETDKRGVYQEVQVHLGSALLAIWLIIGGFAAGERGEYTNHRGCSGASTIGVTMLAGALNYMGVDPHITCSTPQPSN